MGMLPNVKLENGKRGRLPSCSTGRDLIFVGTFAHVARSPRPCLALQMRMDAVPAAVAAGERCYAGPAAMEQNAAVVVFATITSAATAAERWRRCWEARTHHT